MGEFNLQEEVSAFRTQSLNDWKVRTIANLEEEITQINEQANSRIIELKKQISNVTIMHYIPRSEGACRDYGDYADTLSNRKY